MGFNFLWGLMCSMLTTVVLPNSMQIDHYVELRKKDIIIYNGKGPFLNAAFRLETLVALTKEIINTF